MKESASDDRGVTWCWMRESQQGGARQFVGMPSSSPKNRSLRLQLDSMDSHVIALLRRGRSREISPTSSSK